MQKILCFIALISLLSCGENKPNETIDKSMVFRYNEKAGIATLDPMKANDMQHNWVFYMLYNGLVSLDENLKITPSIASDWDVSEDGKTYTFHLREDVYFHDHPEFENGKGRLVVAQDFVSTYFRIIDQHRGLKSFTDKIDYSNADQPGIYAKDKFTVELKLTDPYPPLLGILSMQMYSVLPMEIVSKIGDDFRSSPIGTGPFKLAGWEEGSSLILVRNENYFEVDESGVRLPYLDRVELSFIKDPYAEFMNFSKKKLDMVSALEGAVKDKVIDSQGNLKSELKEKFVIDSRPFLNTEYLGFVVSGGEGNVYNNVYLRRALNYAIDRVKMITFLKNNMGIPAIHGFVPQGFPGYDATKINGYDYNPDKARELLKEAGYPGGKALPVLTLYTTAQYRELCEYIEYQLKQVNILIKIEMNNPVVNRENISNGQFKFFRKSWIADYPDPENYLSLFYSKNQWPNGANYTKYSNSKFDQLYEKSLVETDEVKRNDLYLKMDQMVIDDAPVIPLYYDKSFRLYHHDLKGMENNPINLLDLKRVRK